MSVPTVNSQPSSIATQTSFQQRPARGAQAANFRDLLSIKVESPRLPVERPTPLPRPIPSPRPPIVKVPIEPRPGRPPIEKRPVPLPRPLPPRIARRLIHKLRKLRHRCVPCRCVLPRRPQPPAEKPPVPLPPVKDPKPIRPPQRPFVGDGPKILQDFLRLS